MNLKDYFNTLLPTFERHTIQQDVIFSLETLETILLSMYDIDKVPKFKESISFLHINEMLKETCDVYKTDTYVTNLNTINMILKNYDDIVSTVKEEFAGVSIKSVIDYYKLNLLKYFEALNFFNDYALRFISVATWEVTVKGLDVMARGNIEVAIGDTGIAYISNPYVKAQREFIMNPDNVQAFAINVNMLGIKFSEYLKTIKDLKGHQYSDSDWEDGNRNFNSNLDPHKTGFISVTGNAFYHIGLMVNGWRVGKYKQAQQDFQSFQSMLLILEEQKGSTTNEVELNTILRRINSYTNEANKLHGKIEAFENS